MQHSTLMFSSSILGDRRWHFNEGRPLWPVGDLLVSAQHVRYRGLTGYGRSLADTAAKTRKEHRSDQPSRSSVGIFVTVLYCDVQADRKPIWRTLVNIGIFDSGSGGLTVMRALDGLLPDRSLVYLGDHGNAPYGDRSPEEIYALTLRGIERLFQENCPLVIIACNTAAARGLRRLQREWLPLAHPDRRVLGVIVPVVEDVTGMRWSADQHAVPRVGHEPDVAVAVFATQHTVESGAFAGEIHKRAPHVEVWQQACPKLVPLIEADACEYVLRNNIEDYVADLRARMSGREPDVCILGCTHYPLVESLFQQALPQGTRILSQPEVTARSLMQYFRRHPEFDQPSTGARRFLTTGEATLVSRIASRFFGSNIEFLSSE